MSTRYLTSPVLSAEIPRGIPYIVGNEAAERFSFYGMKTILAIFMTRFLLNSTGQPDFMSEAEAKEWIHYFVFAVYATPLLGAILSDWLLGKYRTIISLSLVYCAGHAVLALIGSSLAEQIAPRWLLFFGLALIAVGSGGIKPCVSAHVGDQFGALNQHLLSKIYGWFYFAINLGSTISTLLTPVLLDRVGPDWAFGVPGILMGVATFVFWLGRHKFVHVPPAGASFFRETFSREGIQVLLNLIPIYLCVTIFWSLFDQTASAWVLQAEHMNRTIIDTSVAGYSLRFEALSSQLQATNPILVMILIPVFSYVIYPWLGRLFEVSPLRKIAIGLFLTVVAFAIPAWIEQRIANGETPHIIWQIVAYVFITIAEVMVSITTLEFSYTQAPQRMKSFIMAIYMLSVSLGNLLTAVVNGLIQNADGTSKLEGADYYWFFTALMFITACLFTAFMQFYRGQTFIQGEDA
ncbi:MAG: POT family MFS transporter [Planctomycetes bacterium]|nr:POT family MFS transporter [Planctomycetota bacterium]